VTELRGLKWGQLCKDLLSKEGLDILSRGHSLQWCLSEGLKKQNFVVINSGGVGGFIIEFHGVRFYAHPQHYQHIFSAWRDYPLGKIREGDVVVDIGCNIGAFAIPASLYAKRVYAIDNDGEALRGLGGNIKLNNRNSIEVIEAEFPKEIGLAEFGKVDYLKIDCEGCEWLMNPEWFEGIRLITGECHFETKEQRKRSRWNDWENWFGQNGYEGEVTRSGKGRWLHFWMEREQ